MTRKSHAKVNIFLKITGKRDNYHTIASRFVKVQSLFDTVSFRIKECKQFTLKGDFGCNTTQNTIYKAYLQLCEISNDVEGFFKNYEVFVEKNIPEFAGLGGGSSNCATFILMVNDVCNLKLSKEKMATIGLSIGADVPFFIYEYNSANVTGIGEIVLPFEEDFLNLEITTPNIKCNTGEIFNCFRQKYYKLTNNETAQSLLSMKSKDIIKTLSINEANDLFKPAVYINSELSQYGQDSFFSGSGSSFFKVVEGLIK